MKDNIYEMGEERKDSAKEFLERITDKDCLSTTINTLDGVMDVLMEYAIELKTTENRKSNDAILMIHQLNIAINALKYIGAHNVLNKEVEA